MSDQIADLSEEAEPAGFLERHLPDHPGLRRHCPWLWRWRTWILFTLLATLLLWGSCHVPVRTSQHTRRNGAEVRMDRTLWGTPLQKYVDGERKTMLGPTDQGGDWHGEVYIQDRHGETLMWYYHGEPCSKAEFFRWSD